MEQMRWDLDSVNGTADTPPETPAAKSPAAPRRKPAATASARKAAPSAAPDPTLPLEAEDAPAKKSSEPQIITVSDVNRAVKATLETTYKTLWVKGEISNFKPHSSGHYYFCLKDAKASIN